MGSNVRLAVVMDPIEHIKFAKDTTLAMLLAAQARGWGLSYLEQGDLRLRDGVAEGARAPLSVRPIRGTGTRWAQPQVAAAGRLRRHPDAQGSAVRYRISSTPPISSSAPSRPARSS